MTNSDKTTTETESAPPARPVLPPSGPGRFGRFEEPDLYADMPRFHWSVPWSDLMMTMFVLFTVLFVYASSKMDYMQAFRGSVEFENVDHVSEVGTKPGDTETYSKPTPGLLPEVGPQQLYETINAAVNEAALMDVDVELDGDTIRISMHGPLLFDRFSADLNPGAEAFLATVAKIIAKANYGVTIHGHTDSTPVHTPEFDTNWELSTQRAVNVAKRLIALGHVDPRQITAAGHSMYRPRTPNISAEGKLRNRRVEIELTRPEAPPEADLFPPQGDQQ